jgi:hypothetical protein
MSDGDDRPAVPTLHILAHADTHLPAAGLPSCTDEAVICERCGKAAMYRMHAVWRCPECGFKTDCCGW